MTSQGVSQEVAWAASLGVKLQADGRADLVADHICGTTYLTGRTFFLSRDL